MFIYPWGDMHSLNLGWFLMQFKEWVEKIQEYLRQQLPDFMIPQFVIQLSAMPMSPNGKINRKKLINNHQMSQLFKNGTVAPMTNNEKIFYDLAKQVLKVDHFGVTDDLSLIGLNLLTIDKRQFCIPNLLSFFLALFCIILVIKSLFNSEGVLKLSGL